ncbi:MAG: MFS transporter [Candidatus Omnitrophica bacterium]|nr:MFS transporter [Candidatus Omnitrophota bacterium]
MFSSLKVRNFRLYWMGMFVSLIGTWIQAVAQSWLVFALTKSVFLLGLVGFLSSAPVFFLSLFGGVFADRVNKKRILLFTQNAFMLLAFALALLVQFKVVTPSQIMFIAVLNGIVMSFDAPTRQSIIVDLVGKGRILNAIALNSAAFNSSRIIGPAVAGILIASVGMTGCFYINGISFLAVIIALLLIKVNLPQRKSSELSFMKDLGQGLAYIKSHSTIMILISMVAVSSFFGVSYAILMPVFANDVLKVGVKGLGILMAASGLGALIAALLLARMGDFRNKGRFLIISSLIFSLSVVLFALSKSYALSLLVLVVIGWSSVSAMSITNTLLQTTVSDEFRGRVMSAFMFTFAGIMPFGNLVAGAFSQAFGVSLTVACSGIICALFFVFISVKYPKIWEIQ